MDFMGMILIKWINRATGVEVKGILLACTRRQLSEKCRNQVVPDGLFKWCCNDYNEGQKDVKSYGGREF
jgi:hypothetical protein